MGVQTCARPISGKGVPLREEGKKKKEYEIALKARDSGRMRSEERSERKESQARWSPSHYKTKPATHSEDTRKVKQSNESA